MRFSNSKPTKQLSYAIMAIGEVSPEAKRKILYGRGMVVKTDCAFRSIKRAFRQVTLQNVTFCGILMQQTGQGENALMSDLSDRKQAFIKNDEQKIKTRKHFILTIMFAILLFLVGCGVLNMFAESYEDIRDEMLQHLYEKYGIEFTGVSLERGHHDHLIAYPTGGDRDNDFVSMQRHVRDGEVEFRDTFFSVVIRDDLEAGVAEALADIGLPFKVFFSGGAAVYGNKFDGTKTFADFNSWVADGNPFRLSVSVFLRVDSVEEIDAIANRAFEKIQETGYLLRVNLQFASGSVFEQITRTNTMDIIIQNHDDITLVSSNLN